MNFSSIDELLSKIQIGDWLGRFSKWSVLIFLGLLALFALIMAKQIVLLNEFLPTPKGKALTWLGFFYVAALLALLAMSFIVL